MFAYRLGTAVVVLIRYTLPARVMSDLPRWHTPSGAVAAKTPATSTARDADYLLDDNYLFGQNMTEYNPAPSRSGHPLLSGRPTIVEYSPNIHHRDRQRGAALLPRQHQRYEQRRASAAER